MVGGLENQGGLLGKGLDNRGGEDDPHESSEWTRSVSQMAGTGLCTNMNSVSLAPLYAGAEKCFLWVRAGPELGQW